MRRTAHSDIIRIAGDFEIAGQIALARRAPRKESRR
jgi:hypothetical protein